jgi:hypothetical protein
MPANEPLATGFFGVVPYGLVAGGSSERSWRRSTRWPRAGIRDFGSVSGIEAASYEVQVEQDVADRAKELLGELAGS